MSVSPGARLGPYEIAGPVGAGPSTLSGQAAWAPAAR